MTESIDLDSLLGSLEAALEPMWHQDLTHEVKCLLRLTCRTLRMSLDRMVSRLIVHDLQQIEMVPSILERPWLNVRAVELHASGQVAQESAERAVKALLEARTWTWTHMRLPWSCISSDPGVLLRLTLTLQSLRIDGILGAADLSPLLNLQGLSSLSLSMAKGAEPAKAIDLVRVYKKKTESNLPS